MDVPLLTDDFREFLKSLNANHVDYLLVGGYAVGLHGYPPATIDLDVWVMIEVMTAIDGVQFDPCHQRAVIFAIDGLPFP
jgi:hypothetical protein